jgi:hypothetical protein
MFACKWAELRASATSARISNLRKPRRGRIGFEDGARALERARRAPPRALMSAPMRASSLRQIAALATAGALFGGALGGCGKGHGSAGTGSSASTLPAPVAHGVVGISTKNTTRLGGADPASDAAAVAEAIYPGLTPATRPQVVVLVVEHDWYGALAAATLASAPLGAPLLYADGDKLPEASAQALRAMRPLGASSLAGAQVIRVGTSAPVPDGYHVRDALEALGDAASQTVKSSAAGTSTGQGSESLGTSASAPALGLELQLFAESASGRHAHEVLVLATDAPRALQMPAAALASESGAPILFVTSAEVPTQTATALRRLHKPTIYVIAPTTLHAGAYSALARLGTVVHVSGASGASEPSEARASSNPIENAISVSRFSHGAFGWGIHEAGHGLVFANVARPLDAPAAAPLSAHGDYGPLLLLERSASVPAALTKYLSDIEPGYTTAVSPVREVYNHGWVIGDESAVSALAQAELDTVLEIAPRQSSTGEQSVAEAE